MKVSRRAAVLCLGASLTARFASADEVEGLLGRVTRARASVRTLRGPFTQTRRIGLLASDVRSSGHVVLVRPDRLRWELEPPDAVTFWVTPEGLSYRSAHGQGRLPPARSGLASVLEDVGALLGGDLQSLRRRWSLRVVRDEADGAEVEVTPRTPAPAMLERMQIGLAADLVAPKSIVLVEGPRDRTTITFGAMEVNAPVDDALMRP